MTSFDDTIGRVLEWLDYLESRGVDVGDLVKELDNAVRLMEAGRVDEARRVIDKVIERISELNATASTTYIIGCATRILTLAAILSLPIIAYYTIPRINMLLWYWFRRRWVVRVGESDHR